MLLALCAALLMLVPAVAGGESGAPEALTSGRGVPESATECTGFRRAPVEGDKQAVSPRAANPLAGESFYVDDKRSRFGHKGFREPAFGEYSSSRGRKRDLYARIALQPRFKWFGRFDGDTTTPGRGLDDLRLRVCTFLADAEQQGAVPLMTVLRHQGRACNNRYQAGGVKEDNATKLWYEAFAQAVGESRVVIAFEPDSVGTVECLAPSRRKARMNLLRHGIDVLSKLPNATVYLEASASDWRPAKLMASRLRYIGIAKIRGFMHNVTHFDWTASNIRYGRGISRRVGGKPFIISTNHSGRGPVHYRKRFGGRNRRIVVNCHPRFRGLGPSPSTQTGNAKVDAFMWISRPGYSRGACNGGPAKEGDWWPKRALELAKFATQRRGPAGGTRYGFPRDKFSLRLVAGDQLK